MSLKAYVLIETKIEKISDVVKTLRKLEGVASADNVTGPYDAIATIEAETLNDIGDLVTAKLNSINGILRAVTCIRMEAS